MVDLYINKIIDLYSLKEHDISKLNAGREQIASALEPFRWEDTELAIDHFYVRISDKQRPKISQICAILNDWHRQGKVDKNDASTDVTPETIRPRTKLFTIAIAFDRMMQIFEESGVVLYADSPRPISSILDEHGKIILSPRIWLREELKNAMTQRPDLFAPYPHVTFWEQLAIAFQNKLIKIKVRNWSEYATTLKRRPRPQIDLNQVFNRM